MAEILFAARNLPSGYRRGDPICAQPDGHVWGRAETLPDFCVVAVAGLDHSLAQSRITELWTDAVFGEDSEFNAPDLADRRVQRHRRRIRLAWDDLPGGVQNQLTTVGRVEVNLNQIRPYVRRLAWNRIDRRVDLTVEEDF